MVVEVHLHTTLQREGADGPERQLAVELPRGSALEAVLSQLQIDLDPEHLLLVVNGRLAEPDQLLSEGDIIHLIPAISGG